jgi:hypothetical protein
MREHTDRLVSLTYLSTATSPFGPAALEDLLAASRERNHSHDLTGMLLHAGGHFVQTLEGPVSAVDATFDRIGRDPRHRNLIVALREPIETRVFPDWSMGFETLTPDQAAQLPGFTAYLDAGTVPAEAGRDLGRAGIFHRVFRDNMR